MVLSLLSVGFYAIGILMIMGAWVFGVIELWQIGVFAVVAVFLSVGGKKE